jgi:hypothetical protein
VEFVAESICKQEFSDQKFRLGVLAPDLAHVVAPRLFVVNITHATKVNKALAIALF